MSHRRLTLGAIFWNQVKQTWHVCDRCDKWDYLLTFLGSSEYEQRRQLQIVLQVMTFHYSLHGNLRFRSMYSYLVFAKVRKVSWDFLTSCPGLQSLLVWNDDCYNIRLKLKKKTCLVPSPVLGSATAFSASLTHLRDPGQWDPTQLTQINLKN